MGLPATTFLTDPYSSSTISVFPVKDESRKVNVASSFGRGGPRSRRPGRAFNVVNCRIRTSETYSSVTFVTTLERAFNLDICIICLFLSKDGTFRPHRVFQDFLHEHEGNVFVTVLKSDQPTCVPINSPEER